MGVGTLGFLDSQKSQADHIPYRTFFAEDSGTLLWNRTNYIPSSITLIEVCFIYDFYIRQVSVCLNLVAGVGHHMNFVAAAI